MQYPIISILAILVVLFFIFGIKPKTKVISEVERGLLFQKGKFKSVLLPGVYTVKEGFLLREQVDIVSHREQSLVISSQEVLTKDNISIKISVLLQYLIEKPELAYLILEDVRDKLYQEAQLHARDAIRNFSLSEFMEKRKEVNELLENGVQENLKKYGFQVIRAQVKDVMLSPELKDAFTKEIIAEKEARAALTIAREKVASARALSNAAKIIAQDPMILRLKELEVAKIAATSHDNKLVVHLGKEI
jgi:regulator of protease activity HflC (stomatin/prohibitin superfamily)